MAADARIEVVVGDITHESVDAIVNAANGTLLGGGGVDGAIHRAGGPAILAECRRLNGCATGDAKITTAGKLSAKYVIHTVGPVSRYGRHGEPELLSQCYRRSMEVAEENACRSVSFPAISCGVYGYPIPEAARIAVGTVNAFLGSRDSAGLFERVRFVLFSQEIFREFEKALRGL